MPDNQAPEKYQQMETMGAEVIRVKAVPYADPNHYQKVAKRLAEEIPGAMWGNQFDNTANRDAHERTTGPKFGGKPPASSMRLSPRQAREAPSPASRVILRVCILPLKFF